MSFPDNTLAKMEHKACSIDSLTVYLFLCSVRQDAPQRFILFGVPIDLGHG